MNYKKNKFAISQDQQEIDVDHFDQALLESGKETLKMKGRRKNG